MLNDKFCNIWKLEKAKHIALVAHDGKEKRTDRMVRQE